jgi:hypothetical protein
MKEELEPVNSTLINPGGPVSHGESFSGDTVYAIHYCCYYSYCQGSSSPSAAMAVAAVQLTHSPELRQPQLQLKKTGKEREG